MAEQRRVKLFRNGRNQAVRIPVEFELAGTEAILYREGDFLILRPTLSHNLSDLLETWSPLNDEWQDPVDLPSKPETIFWQHKRCGNTKTSCAPALERTENF